MVVLSVSSTRPLVRVVDKWRHNIMIRSLSQSSRILDLVSSLRELDTAALCDADKSMGGCADGAEGNQRYEPISLLKGLRPLTRGRYVMVGVARTIQCSEPNDFLAVLDGLFRAEMDEVLVINTCLSTRAVAGELFCAEAERRGLTGIIVDGPMRDTASLSDFPRVRCFSSSLTPYSGTAKHLGKEQIPVNCGGVEIKPGDILVGDDDGIIAAGVETFEAIIDVAREIKATEAWIKMNVSDQNKCLHSMMNYKAHVETIRKGESSSLKLLG